jgi:hypothetical protein
MDRPRSRPITSEHACRATKIKEEGHAAQSWNCNHANLAFHAAWDFGARGRVVANPEATRMLYSMYPSQVRHWITSRGGLTPRMIFLRGKQLEAIYRPCYLDAQASAAR